MRLGFLNSYIIEMFCSFFDLLVTDNHLNIVFEYIESGSLHSVMEQFGVFPEALVGLYISQVLKGLHYLHSKGVIHRDIKGSNLLITKSGEIKLADFGIASFVALPNENETNKEIQQQQSNWTCNIGSPYWMAPEAITLPNSITAKSDIWSLGIVVIELIQGNPPFFEIDMIHHVLYKIVTETDLPTLPEDISKECSNFIEVCLNRDPTLRLSARKLLKHEWIELHRKENDSSEETSESAKSHLSRHIKRISQYNLRISRINRSSINSDEESLGLKDEPHSDSERMNSRNSRNNIKKKNKKRYKVAVTGYESVKKKTKSENIFYY